VAGKAAGGTDDLAAPQQLQTPDGACGAREASLIAGAEDLGRQPRQAALGSLGPGHSTHRVGRRRLERANPRLDHGLEGLAL